MSKVTCRLILCVSCREPNWIKGRLRGFYCWKCHEWNTREDVGDSRNLLRMVYHSKAALEEIKEYGGSPFISTYETEIAILKQRIKKLEDRLTKRRSYE